MRKIKKPEMNQRQIIDDCMENMRASEKRERLDKSKNTLVVKSEEYDKLAEISELRNIGEEYSQIVSCTKEDLISLYNDKFSKKGQIARKYYDKIMLLPPFGRCPLCGQREVSTLDHYLPKSKFPMYSVTANNLVPICFECNKSKGDIIPIYDEEMIHPYYDNFDDANWIKARLIEGETIGFEYYVEKPSEWDEIKFRRAKRHFDRFSLNKLYKPYAAERFVSEESRINRLYRNIGKELTKQYIYECIEDEQKNGNNTWQAAMYEAIYNSDWFWNNYINDKL